MKLIVCINLIVQNGYNQWEPNILPGGYFDMCSYFVSDHSNSRHKSLDAQKMHSKQKHVLY